jgi:hypothetical protein
MNRLTSSLKPRPYPIPKGTPLPDDVATLRWLANFPTREEWEAKEQERIQALKREISRDYSGNGEASSTGFKQSVQLDAAPPQVKRRVTGLDYGWTPSRHSGARRRDRFAAPTAAPVTSFSPLP